MSGMITDTIPIEGQLILACGRADAGVKQQALIRQLLRKQVDWEQLVKLAHYHWMRPILYHHLRQYPDLVPVPVLDVLKGRFGRNGKRNLTLAAEIIRLVKLFQAANIDVIPYKGPVLAQQTFGNMALREFGDLDFMVRKADYARAREIIVADRYLPQRQPPSGYEHKHFDYVCEELFFRDDERVMVELQCAIAPWYYAMPIGEDLLWGGASKRDFLGHDITCLRPEAELFVLAVHGSKHAWERLEWLGGVAQFIDTHENLEWGWMLNTARSTGTLRMFLLGLKLARDWMSTPLPPVVEQEVENDDALDTLPELLHERLWTPTNIKLSDRAVFSFCIKLRERAKDRRAYFLRSTLTPTIRDWESVPLPRALGSLHYVTRPFRLVHEHFLGGREPVSTAR